MAARLLSSRFSPMRHEADPKEHVVWLLNNTAWHNDPARTITASLKDGPATSWQAEYTACFFKKGEEDTGRSVAWVADKIGLDGKLGENKDAMERIASRIQPFINPIVTARRLSIQIPTHTEKNSVQVMRPSNNAGLSIQTLHAGGDIDLDGSRVTVSTINAFDPPAVCHTRFAGPDGWAVVSDVDDTIKYTQTPDAIGILQTTFADIPSPIKDMPKLYSSLNERFENPAWFYLSASPYQLYPFLHKFLHENYPPGQLILRHPDEPQTGIKSLIPSFLIDRNKWSGISALFTALTTGVQTYKVAQMLKLYDKFPHRKVICVGDSTQSDPEAYAEVYAKRPGWIKQIFIRKVTDVPNMEEKNTDERFKKAFEKVPNNIWRIFSDPEELNSLTPKSSVDADEITITRLEKTRSDKVDARADSPLSKTIATSEEAIKDMTTTSRGSVATAKHSEPRSTKLENNGDDAKGDDPPATATAISPAPSQRVASTEQVKTIAAVAPTERTGSTDPVTPIAPSADSKHEQETKQESEDPNHSPLSLLPAVQRLKEKELAAKGDSKDKVTGTPAPVAPSPTAPVTESESEPGLEPIAQAEASDDPARGR